MTLMDLPGFETVPLDEQMGYTSMITWKGDQFSCYAYLGKNCVAEVSGGTDAEEDTATVYLRSCFLATTSTTAIEHSKVSRRPRDGSRTMSNSGSWNADCCRCRRSSRSPSRSRSPSLSCTVTRCRQDRPPSQPIRYRGCHPRTGNRFTPGLFQVHGESAGRLGKFYRSNRRPGKSRPRRGPPTHARLSMTLDDIYATSAVTVSRAGSSRPHIRSRCSWFYGSLG